MSKTQTIKGILTHHQNWSGAPSSTTESELTVSLQTLKRWQKPGLQRCGVEDSEDWEGDYNLTGLRGYKSKSGFSYDYYSYTFVTVEAVQA